MSLGTDGRISSQGSLSSALAKDKKLAKEAIEEAQVDNKAEETVDESDPVAESAAPKKDGKLIVAEEISEGHVGWPARKPKSYAGGICLRLTPSEQSSSTSAPLAETLPLSSGRCS